LILFHHFPRLKNRNLACFEVSLVSGDHSIHSRHTGSTKMLHCIFQIFKI
jgi:hypothetical protein